jgi:hypothetical protein
LNRIKDLEETHIYSNLIVDKGTKNMYWRKDSHFNKLCWEYWLSTCRKLKLDPCLSPCTHTYTYTHTHTHTHTTFKVTKDLNIRQYFESTTQNIRKTLEDVGIGNIFLSSTSIVWEIRARIDK